MLNLVQFRSRIYEGYFIDTETAIITDKDGNVQPTKVIRDRTCWRGMPLHRIQMNSAFGWKKRYDVHHIDGNKLNDRLDNLMYLTRSEHIKIHQAGSNNVTCYLSEEAKQRKANKISIARQAELEKLTEEEIHEKYAKIGAAAYAISEDKLKAMLEKRKEKMTGKFWVHKGEEQMLLNPGDKIPDGYELGRPKRKAV